MSKIHSSWHNDSSSTFANGFLDTYFIDEHPQRTQWSRHTTVGELKQGVYVVYESWITMPKGLLLSKWFYNGQEGI